MCQTGYLRWQCDTVVVKRNPAREIEETGIAALQKSLIFPKKKD
jgi:hypothetical protein